MKKRILSLLLLCVIIVPCAFLFSACGEIKSLVDTKFIFSKVEVEGSITADDYAGLYRAHTFSFAEETVVFTDGINEDIYDYKFDKSKIYLKDQTEEEFSGEVYAVISGKYMVVSETVEGGIVKVYFKAK